MPILFRNKNVMKKYAVSKLLLKDGRMCMQYNNEMEIKIGYLFYVCKFVQPTQTSSNIEFFRAVLLSFMKSSFERTAFFCTTSNTELNVTSTKFCTGTHEAVYR